MQHLKMNTEMIVENWRKLKSIRKKYIHLQVYNENRSKSANYELRKKKKKASQEVSGFSLPPSLPNQREKIHEG